MTEIKWVIDPDDVEWVMDWTRMKDKDGAQSYPDKIDEVIFEEESALALLLINEVIFLNDHWWEKEWPEAARGVTSLNVSCNDVFAWGCADGEELPYRDIETLYRMWRKDPVWGSAVWCMIQRNQMPQKPVENIINKAGIWDLSALQLGENTRC